MFDQMMCVCVCVSELKISALSIPEAKEAVSVISYYRLNYIEIKKENERETTDCIDFFLLSVELNINI